jgi:hypothetical protein
MLTLFFLFSKQNEYLSIIKIKILEIKPAESRLEKKAWMLAEQH